MESTDEKKDINYFWPKILIILERNLSSTVFVSWIKPMKPFNINEKTNEFILIAPEEVTKSTVEHRHLTVIKQIVSTVTLKDYTIKIILPTDIDYSSGEVHESKVVRPVYGTNLKDKYIFENFVKGKSNEFAFVTSMAVAERPGKTSYNPLFLYGGVGLGKTHLMHSIGNFILHLDPEAKVLYTSAENMMNEFITSLVARKNQEFRDKYRKIDVLLIDDIQFLTDKEGTQEEFFHTFNALYNDNKQIVISSDKPPIELKTLESRLRSRFGSGLTVDITLPDFETRTAILEKKAQLDNINIPSEVIRYIAKKISSNIRELEGALIKVTAYSKLVNVDITIEMTERALKDVVNDDQEKVITIEYIQEVVAKYYKITVDDMKSKKRNQTITLSRQIAMFVARKILDVSLSKVGTEFGGRDHATVIHACNKINELNETDPVIEAQLEAIEKEIISDN